MDPSVVQALTQATEAQINQFQQAITQRELLVKQAVSANVTVTPEDLQQIRTEHDSAITLLGSILSLSPEVLRDSVGNGPHDRVNFAMGRVNEYMDRVVQGRARFFPVPPFLGQTLRAHADWSVAEAGVPRAVERAQQLRGDSTRAGGGAATRLASAPGPAPVDTTRRPPR